MAYKASPRPTFTEPTHIPYENVARHLWGDETSGEVADWIYVSSAEIHQLVFGVPPGGFFRHSDQFRTIFAADEVLYVLSGLMILANPESGEVHRVEPGEAVFFRRDTWHHCFNHSDEPLRVLEFFAPPPFQGTSGAYAQTQSYLVDSIYTQDQWLEKWPVAQPEAKRSFTMKIVRDKDILWRLEDRNQSVLTGILASTEQLTVGRMDIRSGQHSDVQRHNGEESLYLVEGTLNIRLPDQGGQSWFEIHPGDGFYLPKNAAHQYYNMGEGLVRLLFAVAPSYLPTDE